MNFNRKIIKTLTEKQKTITDANKTRSLNGKFNSKI